MSAAAARVRPAEARERLNPPWRWRLFSPIRLLRPLTEFPLSRLRGKHFYLHGQPRPNSKTAAVVHDLKRAGIENFVLAHHTVFDKSALIKSIRLIIRLPWAVGFVLVTFKRCRRLDRVHRQILLNYAFARRWLRNRPDLMPIIISDVSPSRHALWAAAATEGNRAIWWQDDFHHHWPLSYTICGAAVLNEAGFAVAKAKEPASVIAKRPTKLPSSVGPIPNKPVVGMATNVSFSVGQNEIASLKSLAATLQAEVIHLRLHPNSHLTAMDFYGAPVKLASSDEPMDRFAARIDLALVGNSAAQLWLIRNGVPVIHVSGFDQQGYDCYGYVKRGLVYGSKSIDQIQVSDVVRFYKDPDELLEKVTEYTTVNASQCTSELQDFKKLYKLKPL